MRRGSTLFVALLFALLNGEAGRAEEARIVVESRTARADDLGFGVYLDTDTAVSGVSNDVGFDPRAPIAARSNGRPDCRATELAGRDGSAFAFQPPACVPGVSCTAVRALVLALSNVDPIPSGSRLYTCRLAADTPPGRYPLRCLNPVASNPEAEAVAATCVDGEIEVVAGTVLSAGTDYVRPGDTALIDVAVFSNEAASRIDADLSVPPLSIRGVSAPACVTRGDDLVAAFTYRPAGCTPGDDCTAAHATVASRSGQPFASGAVLFTCGVDVPASTPSGEYVVHLGDPVGTTAEGTAATVTATDGAVRVDGPPRTPTEPQATPSAAHSALAVGSARGASGDVVQITVTLHTDERISGVQNDLRFAAQAPIAALATGEPDCTPDTSVDWFGPEFAFRPPACTPGIDCTGIRAVILSAAVAPIPDGTVLYTCTVAIDPGAVGSSDLACFNVRGSTEDGRPLPVTCSDGRIEVVPPSPVPTATSWPPPTPAGRADVTASSSGSGGCAIAPPSHGAWPLAAPLLLLALRRRVGDRVQRGRPPGAGARSSGAVTPRS